MNVCIHTAMYVYFLYEYIHVRMHVRYGIGCVSIKIVELRLEIFVHEKSNESRETCLYIVVATCYQNLPNTHKSHSIGDNNTLIVKDYITSKYRYYWS